MATLEELKTRGNNELINLISQTNYPGNYESWKKIDLALEACIREAHNLDNINFILNDVEDINYLDKYDRLNLSEVKVDKSNIPNLEMLFTYNLLRRDNLNLNKLIEITEETTDKRIFDLRMATFYSLKNYDKLRNETSRIKKIDKENRSADYFDVVANLLQQPNSEDFSKLINGYWFENSFVIPFLLAAQSKEISDFRRSITSYNKLIANFPENKYLYKYRASAYKSLNMLKDAESYYLTYIKYYSNDPEVITELINLFPTKYPPNTQRNLDLFSSIKYSDISFENIRRNQENGSNAAANVPKILQIDKIYDIINNIKLNRTTKAKELIIEELQKYGEDIVSSRFVRSYLYYLMSIVNFTNLHSYDGFACLGYSFRSFPTKDIFNSILIFPNKYKNFAIDHLLKNPDDYKKSMLYHLLSLNMSWLARDNEKALSIVSDSSAFKKNYCGFFNIEGMLLIDKGDFIGAYDSFNLLSRCSGDPIELNFLIYRSLTSQGCDNTLKLFHETKMSEDYENYYPGILAEIAKCYSLSNQIEKTKEIRKHIIRNIIKQGRNPLEFFFSIH